MVQLKVKVNFKIEVNKKEEFLKEISTKFEKTTGKQVNTLVFLEQDCSGMYIHSITKWDKDKDKAKDKDKVKER